MLLNRKAYCKPVLSERSESNGGVGFVVSPKQLSAPSASGQFRIQRRCKLGESLSNLSARPRRETESKRGIDLLFHETGRERGRPHPNLCTDMRDDRQILFAPQPGDEMQAGLGNL